MDPKPDKESEKHGDIVLLFEIIADSDIGKLAGSGSKLHGRFPPSTASFMHQSSRSPHCDINLLIL
jgi:hypothetical protein